MKNIGFDFAPFYGIDEKGNVYNTNTGRILKRSKGRYQLKTNKGNFVSVSIKDLYKMVFNKVFCIDNIEDLENEQWKEIEGTEGIYLASTRGRIKSLAGLEAKIMKQYISKKGYCTVDILQNGIRGNRLVHRLIAETWLDRPKEMINAEIHHKNFQANENNIENLLWISKSDHIKLHLLKNKMEQTGNEFTTRDD